jgi:translation initiation factor IF-1
MEGGERWPERDPGHARKVLLMIQKETKPCRRKDRWNSRNLVTEILPDARYGVQLNNGHQLVAYTAGRMRKNRIKTLAGDRVTVEVALRSGKGAIDLSPQGRTCRIAGPSAAASPVSAAMTGRSQIRCGPRHERDASWTASVAAIGTPN